MALCIRDLGASVALVPWSHLYIQGNYVKMASVIIASLSAEEGI